MKCTFEAMCVATFTTAFDVLVQKLSWPNDQRLDVQSKIWPFSIGLGVYSLVLGRGSGSSNLVLGITRDC